MKKWLIIIAVALAIFFVVNHPDPAANTVHKVGSTLSHAADSATTFLTRLTG